MSDIRLSTGQFARLITPVDLNGNPILGGGGGTIVLATFKATAPGTGYSTNDIIILRQTPPAAAEYYNATTGNIITPNPSDLGPVGTAGDASAANQSTQITAANLTNTRLSSVITELQDTLDVGLSGKDIAYYPSYGAPDSTGRKSVVIDAGGSLITRSAALTDEGTYRVNFANTSLEVAIGTVTIVGNVVTGTGFSTVDVHLKDYFKLSADPETAWIQIDSIDSDTQITLISNYVGGSSGAAVRSLVIPVTGAGGSITVSNGQCVLTSGTTSGSRTLINRSVDYAPLVFRTRLSVSQRVANQNLRVGFAQPSATPRYFARFRFEGTVNTVVTCESARNPTTAPSVAETESTIITIPNGRNTSQQLNYRVEQLVEVVRFYVDDLLVAEHSRSLPSAYDVMASGCLIENTGVPSGSTTVTVDYSTVKNHNKIEIGVMSDNERLVASQPPLVPFSFTQAGVIAINTDLLLIDCTQIRTVNLQVTSVGTTGVISTFLTNDLSVVGTAQPCYPIGGTAPITTPIVAGTYNIPTHGARYLRVRLTTATTAGTTTLFATTSQIVHPLPFLPVNTLGQLPTQLGTRTIAQSTAFNPASDAIFRGEGYEFTGTFTRAANVTPYTINDVVGAAATLTATGTAPVAGSTIVITDIELIYNVTALPPGMAGLTFQPYLVTPPSAIADNGAWSLPSGDRASIAFPDGIPLTASLVKGGGSVIAVAFGINRSIRLTGTTFFAYLVTLAAFTPAANSETIGVKVRAILA